MAFSFQAWEGSWQKTTEGSRGGQNLWVLLCGEDRTGLLVAVQTTFLEQAVCGALVVDCCSEPLNINVAETQLEK